MDVDSESSQQSIVSEEMNIDMVFNVVAEAEALDVTKKFRTYSW